MAERLVRADRWEGRDFLEVTIPGCFVFEFLAGEGWMDEAFLTAGDVFRAADNVYGLATGGSPRYLRCMAHGLAADDARPFFIHNDHGQPLVYRLRRHSWPPTPDDDQYRLPQPADNSYARTSVRVGISIDTRPEDPAHYGPLMFPESFRLSRFDGERWLAVGSGRADSFERDETGAYTGIIDGNELTFRSLSAQAWGDRLISDEGGRAAVYSLTPL